MADKDDKNTDEDTGKPGFDPKPVQLGGESIVDRLMPYRKKIGIAILLGFAVWGAIAIVFYLRNNRREKNTAKVAQVLEVAQREVKPAEEPPPTPDPNDKKKEITYKTNKERAEAVLSELAKADAKLSPAYKASLLVQAGKLDDAIAEYRKAQDGTSLDNVLAREGLGIALETKAEAEKDAAARDKGLNEALTVFQAMQPDEAGPRRAYALYHQGRILSLLEKNTEATEAFKKAKEKSGDGPLAEQIDERLAMLGAS